jgi:hypothetical protein
MSREKSCSSDSGEGSALAYSHDVMAFGLSGLVAEGESGFDLDSPQWSITLQGVGRGVFGAGDGTSGAYEGLRRMDGFWAWD